VIERDTIFEFEVAVDDFEAVIGDCVSRGITGIHICRAQRADCGTFGVLINREIIQSNVCRRFVHVTHGDLEGLRGCKATRVRCGDCHRNRVRFFVIERDTVF